MIIKQLGVWYNGSIPVSKTVDGSSILSTPAMIKTKDLTVFFCYLNSIVKIELAINKNIDTITVNVVKNIIDTLEFV